VNTWTDQQLLQEYAERRSEAAFTQLVQRHVDLIYSAALRLVRDSHLAEDVTQGAFVTLARNAHQLTECAVLSGWLHRTARNIAAQTVRTDVRRRAREQEAAAMNDVFTTEPDDNWEQIAPHLDAALGELSDADRDALLLRYFERKSAQEMAQVLGVSGEAAQKRVSRAVERLRELFIKRGITVGASGFALVLTTHAVQAAPAGLSASVITTATGASTLAHVTWSLAAWTKTKIAALALAVLLLGGATIVVVTRSSSARANLATEVPGTGLVLGRSKRTGAPTIMIVVAGSTPARAGLTRGMLIHKIDDVSTTHMDLRECLRRMQKSRVVQLELIDPVRNTTNTVPYEGGRGERMGGIGIALGRDSNAPPTIMAVAPGSVAAHAGLSKGLVIQMIDDVPTAGMKPRDCLNRIQGPPGSVVRLTVFNPQRDLTNSVELTRYRL
jgi:RNA polymerase sigma factor (sigma-70 family)